MPLDFFYSREDKLQKEHDIALNRLNDRKKRFQVRLTESHKQVSLECAYNSHLTN